MNQRVPRHIALVSAVTALALVAGCADMNERQRGTAQGAGLGAVAGALIGSATGGKAGTSAAIGAAVGAVAGNLWSKHMEDQRRSMEAATKGTGMEVTRTADNQLKINVPSEVSFATGSAAIRPELRTVLDTFADGLKGSPTSLVTIVGHTDSTGSDKVNNPLSVDRAQSVRNYLTDRGINASRIQADGRGSREPIADNGNADGRARNRRVEIFLRDPQS